MSGTSLGSVTPFSNTVSMRLLIFDCIFQECSYDPPPTPVTEGKPQPYYRACSPPAYPRSRKGQIFRLASLIAIAHAPK